MVKTPRLQRSCNFLVCIRILNRQWGAKTVGDISQDYNGSLTFPLSFSTSCLMVLPGLECIGVQLDASAAVKSKSSTGCAYTVQEWSGTVQSLIFIYLAIGY